MDNDENEDESEDAEDEEEEDDEDAEDDVFHEDCAILLAEEAADQTAQAR